VGTIESVQDGIELNIVCDLKENVDELEQKRKLGFIWDEASELERLLAVRNILDGMVVIAGCIIGTTSERHCLEVKVCKNETFLMRW
jgi:transcription elongation GreA/GreB family factor